jgi:DNA repair exonuclease SbcCD nuclease subunit
MINKIKSELKTVDKILHIADVHIRNWKRHKEFKLVFDRLFEAAKQLPDNSIITVGGDIVHAKTDMSPELIHMVSYLLHGLADIKPTIVICGNHDTNLNNNNRLDALTPIIEAKAHPNLFYLRDSGVHKIGDVVINVMSLLDSVDKYKTADKIDLKRKCLIAMYHGTIANSKVDSGMNIAHGLDWDTFAGHDLVLLGDIHKRQVLSDNNPLIFYPGSTVQQNFGESYEGHGYAIVDCNSLTTEFFDIPNDYGFYTLEINNGALPSNLPITQRTSVRLKTTNTTPAQLKKVLAEIRKQYKNSDVIVTNLDKNKGISQLEVEESFGSVDVRNVDYQTKLIADYVEQFNLDDELIAKVLEINKATNRSLASSETVRNVTWNPKRFEFSNMFSYGEDNVVNFDSLNGTCGLFAPNHAGKSAVLDALCFCLFDHSFRASKAEQVLNRKKDNFWCKFNFQLNGLDYFIEKTASRYLKGPLAGKLRVDINFWYINEEGQQVSLNGEQRRDTDKIIQSYVGTFDDFILTALSLQGNNSNFIEKTQGERKDLLANFLDLKIFDTLYDAANKEIKTTSVLLEEYQKQDFETALGDAQRLLDSNDQLYKEQEILQSDQSDAIDAINAQILQLAKDLKPNAADGLDIESLKTQSLRKQQEISTKLAELVKCDQQVTKLQQDIETCVSNIKQYNEEQLKAAFLQLTTKLKTKSDLDQKLQHYKLTISAKLDKLSKLEEHEYDPNCKYCTSNVFVKDAIKTKEELDSDKQHIADFLSQRKAVEQFIQDNTQTQKDYEDLVREQGEKARLEQVLALQQAKLSSVKSQLNSYQTSLEHVEDQIKLYNDNLSVIEHNNKLNDQIDTLTSKLVEEKRKADVIAKKLQEIHGKIKVSEGTITQCERNIEHMHQLSEKQTAYEFYLKAVCRDGIPYALISKAIPYLQAQVNNILAQVVDFAVEIETDGKNINVYINYDDNKWPLELASGMERFVSSLAIRVALIKITNLPKPNFIAIDEGLGVLDSSNLNSMHMLFNYLKDMFKFTLVISHIDVVRDMVDNILTIDRRDDLSYIKHL